MIKAVLMKTSEKPFLLLFTSFERQLPGVRETSTDLLPKVHSGQSGPGGSQESRPKYRPPTQGQGPENLIHYLVALRVYLSRKLHQNRRSLAGSGHSDMGFREPSVLISVSSIHLCEHSYNMVEFLCGMGLCHIPLCESLKGMGAWLHCPRWGNT